MPIYEYQCEACNHEMEAMQKMSDRKHEKEKSKQAKKLENKAKKEEANLS